MNILFFCNANNEFGIGHIRRSETIANSLSKLNNKFRISFTGDIDKEFIRRKNIDIDCIELNPNFDEYDLIVFDSYKKEDYEKISSLKNLKIGIDDQEIRDFKDWDLVINCRLKSNYKKYESKKSICGVKYFPFDNKYLSLRKQNIPSRDTKNLFFYFGETVNVELDKKITKLLKRYEKKYNFFIYAKDRGLDNTFELINSSNFFDYFSMADVIIHGGGLTKYEACYIKKFNLSFSINELQKKDTEYLSSLGLSIDMGYYKNIYKTIGKTLDYIENIDIKELQSFEKASAKYFYNNSLKNISKEITKIIIK